MVVTWKETVPKILPLLLLLCLQKILVLLKDLPVNLQKFLCATFSVLFLPFNWAYLLSLAITKIGIMR